MLDGNLAPPRERATTAAPLFGACLLWPNGWMDHDATWYGGRPRPWAHCVRRGPSPFPPKGHSPLIFGPCLVWSNGWMDQDATWYGGRPQPRRLCVRWRPRSTVPKKGAEPPPQFLAHFYFGQTAGCIKMPLGMDVGLSPGDVALDGDPVLLLNKSAEPFPPNFRLMFIVAKRLDGSRCHLARR